MRQMIQRTLWVACVSVLVTSGLPLAAGAYEAITVTNGATVAGKVSFTGSVPAPKTFELRRYYDREYCATLSDGKGIAF